MVYLDWEGRFYYQVDLTAPYMQVVQVSEALPKPGQLGDGPAIDGGDVVDWTLAFAVLALSLVGLLLLLQQVLGRNFRIIRPLYKFQRWFFDPMHHNHPGGSGYDSNVMGDMSDRSYRGRGHEYTFAEDVIPLSMGGRMASPPRRYFGEGGSHREGAADKIGDPSESDDVDDDHGDDDWLVGGGKSASKNRVKHPIEMEMVPPRERARSASGDEFLFGSGDILTMDELGVVEDAEALLVGSPSTMAARFLRDPDCVDMPDLKSRTKVAVPVGVTSKENSYHSRSSLDQSFD